MTALDFSADIGLLAVFLGTTNICLGQLIAVRYSPWRLWPHRRINIFVVHNWTAYLLITSVLIHPLILLFSTNSRWRLLDAAFPVRSGSTDREYDRRGRCVPNRGSPTHLMLSASARPSPVEAVSLPHLCGGYLFLHSRYSCGPQFEGEPNRSSGWRKSIC